MNPLIIKLFGCFAAAATVGASGYFILKTSLSKDDEDVDKTAVVFAYSKTTQSNNLPSSDLVKSDGKTRNYSCFVTATQSKDDDCLIEEIQIDLTKKWISKQHAMLKDSELITKNNLNTAGKLFRISVSWDFFNSIKFESTAKDIDVFSKETLEVNKKFNTLTPLFGIKENVVYGKTTTFLLNIDLNNKESISVANKTPKCAIVEKDVVQPFSEKLKECYLNEWTTSSEKKIDLNLSSLNFTGTTNDSNTPTEITKNHWYLFRFKNDSFSTSDTLNKKFYFIEDGSSDDNTKIKVSSVKIKPVFLFPNNVAGNNKQAIVIF